MDDLDRKYKMAQATVARTKEMLAGSIQMDEEARKYLEAMLERNEKYIVHYERRQWLADLKVGDSVIRMLGGKIPSSLLVTRLTDHLIVCGPWTFRRDNGAEVDADMRGADGMIRDTDGYIKTISLLMPSK